MHFDSVVFVTALLAGGIAAVAGFGIGSLLTPLVALVLGTRLAVAAVSIPHAIGTALRFWLLRGHVDRRVFLRFGLASAAGGLAGALLNTWASNRALAMVFGTLLVFAGISQIAGLMDRVRFGRTASWVAGTLSGLFGGLVGNQGGIRSAALLGFQIERQSLVATATAIGLVVDAARMPVYVWSQGADLLSAWSTIVAATAGVMAGTFAGTHVLARVRERWFRRTIAVLLLALGSWMIARG